MHPYRTPARTIVEPPRRVRALLLGSALVATMTFAAMAIVRMSVRQPAVFVPPSQPAQLSTDLPKVPLRVVWSDTWNGSTRLLGVDAQGHRAMLERYDSARWFIDVVDFESGERIDRWEATPENAKAHVDLDSRAAMSPYDGSFEDDLSRYAGLLRATRGKYEDPQFGVSTDHVVYSTKKGKTITSFIADAVGHSPRKLIDGWASEPRFSPDGTWLVFQGCGPRCATDGYSIFVTRADGGPLRTLATKTVPGQTEAYGPSSAEWSHDGRILVLNWPNHYYANGAPDCVERFDPEKPDEPEIVHCRPKSTASHAGMHFWTGSGSQRVLLGWAGESGPLGWDWISMENGASLGSGMLPKVNGIMPWAHAKLDGEHPTFILSEDDAAGGQELLFVDPKEGSVRVLASAPSQAWWGSPYAQGMQWIDDDTLLALCNMDRRAEMVIVHPSALPWRREP